MKAQLRLLLAAFLVLTVLCGTHVEALATEPEIVDETFTPLPDSTYLDGKGWVTVKTSAAQGFEGDVCVVVRNVSTQETTAIVTGALNAHLGGSWLSEGKYEVVSAYVDLIDSAVVTYEPAVFTVSVDENARLDLTVMFSKNEEPDISQTHPIEETQPEPYPVEPVESTESKEDETDSTEVTEESEPEEIEPKESSSKSFSGVLYYILKGVLATGAFIGIVFLFAYLYRRHMNEH